MNAMAALLPLVLLLLATTDPAAARALLDAPPQQGGDYLAADFDYDEALKSTADYFAGADYAGDYESAVAVVEDSAIALITLRSLYDDYGYTGDYMDYDLVAAAPVPEDELEAGLLFYSELNTIDLQNP